MYNFISPYGTITKYEVPALKGFFIFPRSDSSDAGWTAVRDPDTGELVLPGQPGGEGPYRFIGWGGDTEPAWRINHTPGDFFYGEIDWFGPYKDTANLAKGRYRLSYHGPVTRYFGTDAFRYGSAENHNNVYMEGRCIAVAPYPVLGAALRVEVPEPVDGNPPGPPTIVLIAICQASQGEYVYRKVIPSFSYGVTRRGYSEEFRAREMEPYDEKENPTGWLTIGSFSASIASQFGGATVPDARVPWFFNRSGSKAVTVRECRTTIDILGNLELQQSYNKFTVTIAEDMYSASYEDSGQRGPGFTVVVTTKTIREADWENLTRWPSDTSPELFHRWAVVTIRQRMTMNGFLVVAADFVDDEEVELVYEISHSLRHNHFFYKGLDSVSDFPPGNEAYVNAGDIYGDMQHVAGLNLDVATVQDPYGATAVTFGYNEEAAYVLPGDDRHAAYRRFSGTRSVFETGIQDPDDPFSFFVFALIQHPHVVDLRHKYLASFVDYKIYAGYSTPLLDRYVYEQLYLPKEAEYTTMYSFKQPQEVTAPAVKGFSYTKVWAPGTAVAQGQYEWGNTHIEEYTVLDGLWYMPAFAETRWPANVPNPVDFHQFSTEYKLDTDMAPVYEVLQSISNGYRDLGSGVDDYGNLVFSMAYRDSEGNLKYYNHLDAGDLTELSKAVGDNIRFFQIGVS